MKKILSFALCCCILLISGGCSSSDEPTTTYDEAAVLKKSEEIVKMVNDGKYEDMLKDATKEMQGLTPDKLKESIDGVGQKGNFKEFKDHEMVTKDGFAVMGIIASYENMKIQYTLSFDKDMKLAGFYLKQV